MWLCDLVLPDKCPIRASGVANRGAAGASTYQGRSVKYQLAEARQMGTEQASAATIGALLEIPGTVP
jgi:hypothetical protein